MAYAVLINNKFVDIIYCSSDATALEQAKKIASELGQSSYNVVAC